MGRLYPDLSDEEEREFRAKLNGRTVRETILDSMGIPHEKRKIGRPTAFDAAAAEERVREAYLQKIRDYNALHRADAEEAARALGFDTPEGKSTPALGTEKKRG